MGFQNYAHAFNDPKFWDALTRIAVFFLIQVPLTVLLGLAAALALDSLRMRFARFFRVSLFLPHAVPAVVAALMWGFMYGTRFGLVGNLNDLLGFSLPEPLSGGLVLGAIANIVLWQYLGYDMLIFYAVLQGVSRDIYEAAAIDGAGPFQVVLSLKLPALRPAMTVVGVFSIIGSFQLFNEPHLLSTMAPNSISTSFTPNIYAYNLSFAGQQINYAAAIALVMGVLTSLIALAYQFFMTRGRV